MKKINKYLFNIIFITSIPILIYMLIFTKNGWSSDPESWGVFGDFIGGISNLIIGVLNLYFLIYLSFKISKIDKKRERENRMANLRPLGIIKVFQSDYSVSIKFQNVGLGPLLIEDFHLTDLRDNTIIESYIELIKENQILLDNAPYEYSTFALNPLDSAVAHNAEEILINIVFRKEDFIYKGGEDELRLKKDAIINELNNFQINMAYTDINNEGKYTLKTP